MTPISARRPVSATALLALILVLAGYFGFAQAPAPVAEPLRTAADRPIDIRHIRLDLNVDLPKKTVDALATLQVRSLRQLASISLDAVDFQVKRVEITEGKDVRTARFDHDGTKLTIDVGAWPADREAELRIQYQIREPKAGLHFFGPTEAEPNTPLTVWSQGEPIANRHWIPCIDEPVQRQTTELVVTVADGFEVLSNGKLLERKAHDNKTVTYHWRQDQPHPSYLVTLVVGQFDVVQEDWQGLPVMYYVPKGRKEDVARTFGRTREMLDFFKKRFGVDYPWEKYAQVVVEQFTGGGMENTSATTLTDRALHDARASLDSSPDGLIAHELAHQWWGDMITCRDWAHLWLNEGFASFAEVLWAEHKEGVEEGAYAAYRKLTGAMSGSAKDRPVVDRRYPHPRNMFDARAYPKGAWVLHMLRARLGEEAFWKAIQAYAQEHKLKSVETADFRKVLERVTGRNLERFFYDWTERPGHPVLEVTTEYLPESKQAKVAVKQTQSSEAFHFPLTIAFSGGESTRWDRPLKLEITEKEQVAYIALPDRPQLVVVDPAQTVLADIKEHKGRELWLRQLAEGPVTAQIRAAEHLGKNKTPADREALVNAFGKEKFWGTQVEIAAALGESGGEVCRTALIEGLKHKHPKVRRACASELGKFHKDRAVAVALKELLQKGDESYFVEAAALGSYSKMEQADTVAVLLPWLAKPSHGDVLRVAALDGLGQAQDLSALDTLTAWTKRGKPRAARVAALQALARLAQKANASPEQRQQMVKTVAACLDGEGLQVRLAALTTLRDLGTSSAPTLDALDELARHDPEFRVRDLAKRAAELIRSNSPVPVELTRLREELEQLRKANEALEDRVDKVEKIERR